MHLKVYETQGRSMHGKHGIHQADELLATR